MLRWGSSVVPWLLYREPFGEAYPQYEATGIGANDSMFLLSLSTYLNT